MWNTAAALLVVSGFASLTYQVVWVRLLGLSMGSTSASVSTVLAAFFLGLSLGSYFAERIIGRRTDDLTVYIVLEVVIGVCGLALLPALLFLDDLMALLGPVGTALGAKFVISVVLLLLPTVCMGATFPVMASILIRRQSAMGPQIGQLYSLNTVGAVLGAGLTGFVLIPRLGLDGAVYVAVGANLAVVLMSLWVSRRLELPGHAAAAAEPEAAVRWQASPALRATMLVLLFSTGLAAIATEVGWTKYLALFTGATIYGFSAILTVFLIGIAAGSWAVRGHLHRVRSPVLWLGVGLAALGASLVLARVGLSYLPAAQDYLAAQKAEPWAEHALRYLAVFAILILPTFLFGALFPINLTLYCADVADVRSRIGRGYAVNTVGAIVGAVAAGFWAIPVFGTDVLLTGLAIGVLCLPLLLLGALPGAVARAGIGAAAAGLVLAAAYLPHLDFEALVSSLSDPLLDENKVRKTPEFLFLKEGKAGVITMHTFDGEIATLQNNGLPESKLFMKGTRKSGGIETLLGAVPPLIHDDAENAFVVGFGGGITIEALTLTRIRSIRVVELEPAVVDAVAAVQGGRARVLADPRVRVTFNDARNTLLVEDGTYDIILSQPSHPWRSGAGNLFTRRFFEIVASRLRPGGIYAQWVNVFRMDATTLRSIFKAYYEVFPHGFTMVDFRSRDMLVIGSDRPIRFDVPRIDRRLRRADIRRTLGHFEIFDIRGLLYYFSLSRDEALRVAGDVAPNTDTRILSEVRLAWLTGDPTGDAAAAKLLQRSYSFDVVPFLAPEARADLLYRSGQHFARRNAGIRVKHALTRLMAIDPGLGRKLAREIRSR